MDLTKYLFEQIPVHHFYHFSIFFFPICDQKTGKFNSFCFSGFGFGFVWHFFLRIWSLDIFGEYCDRFY